MEIHEYCDWEECISFYPGLGSPQAVVSKLATIFRVSAKVANGFIAGLALNTAGFGDRIANYLDKNHNGWIGLYQRWKKDTSFKNGLVAQNITYTEWKTE